MRRVDWAAVDEATRGRLDPLDLAYAALDGIEAGLRRFRLRLWLGRLAAFLVVAALTVGGYAARSVVHAGNPDPGLPVVPGPPIDEAPAFSGLAEPRA